MSSGGRRASRGTAIIARVPASSQAVLVALNSAESGVRADAAAGISLCRSACAAAVVSCARLLCVQARTALRPPLAWPNFGLVFRHHAVANTPTLSPALPLWGSNPCRAQSNKRLFSVETGQEKNRTRSILGLVRRTYWMRPAVVPLPSLGASVAYSASLGRKTKYVGRRYEMESGKNGSCPNRGNAMGSTKVKTHLPGERTSNPRNESPIRQAKKRHVGRH